MDSDAASQIWERTDQQDCNWGRRFGEGDFLINDDQEFGVEEILFDPEDPTFDNSPIRIISPIPPPFGEWRLVHDRTLLDSRLAAHKMTRARHENSPSAEKQRRLELLEQLPGFQYRELEESLNRAVYSFNFNAKALVGHVMQYMDAPNDESLGEHFRYKMANALFNFLTSVGTLRDAHRVAHRRIWPMGGPESKTCETCGNRSGGKKRSDWEEKVYSPKLSETFGIESAFLLKLRDYAVHYELPMPSLNWRMSWSEGQSAVYERTFPLSRDTLLKWDGWTKDAKEFLNSQDEEIDFSKVISVYTKAVRGFHTWFMSQVAAALQAEEYTSKAEELRLWLDEKEVKPDWMINNTPIPENWSEIARSEMRKKRVRAKAARWAHGTRSWTVHTIDSGGVIWCGEPSDWTDFPR
ncbi:hypothetical protein ACTD5D_31395 [Nocardia takedensis]|uniref:hypothetical protein n=1 Tax=Nocardia takedensis TaxID=259390 RepID=UPI003F76BE56